MELTAEQCARLLWGILGLGGMVSLLLILACKAGARADRLARN